MSRGLGLVGAVLLAAGCGSQRAGVSSGDAAGLAQVRAGFEVLERQPDPAVVTRDELVRRLTETGLPWRIRDTATGIELLLVPAGSGRRGAPPDDGEASPDERPAHDLVVVEPFYLGRFEVTDAQWRAVMGSSPSFFRGDPNLPVETVDLLGAQAFASRAGFALPTESEWEYACRAGGGPGRYGPLDDIAWHGGRSGGNAGRRTHPVGQKDANALGFHDLLGNVMEWTSSAFVVGEYHLVEPPVDARARMHLGTRAVLRGGSWYDSERRCRPTARYAVERDFRGAHAGLRVRLDASSAVDAGR